MAATIRERSGKPAKGASKDKVARVRVELAPDDVEVVEINWRALTFRENHDVARALGRLCEYDAEGRQIVGPDIQDRALAAAWVVLRRTRPDLKFSDLYDNLTVESFEVLAVDAPEQDLDSPEV